MKREKNQLVVLTIDANGSCSDGVNDEDNKSEQSDLSLDFALRVSVLCLFQCEHVS